MKTQVPIGLDLGGTKLLILGGGREMLVPTGPEFRPAQVREALDQFLESHQFSASGIGLAIPGLVNPDGSVLRCDVIPALDGWNPRLDFENLGCPIAILNDIDAALREELDGATANTTAAVVMVGTGVGAAFMVDGKLLRGQSGLAGELGYMPIETQGSMKRLDELAGGAYMAKQLGIDGATLAERALTNDPATLDVIQQGCHYLGLGLATVINLFNPSRIILGGGATRLPGYFEAACHSATQHSFAEIFAQCKITSAKAGHQAAALGAIKAIQVRGQ